MLGGEETRDTKPRDPRASEERQEQVRWDSRESLRGEAHVEMERDQEKMLSPGPVPIGSRPIPGCLSQLRLM